ncbi:L,D-transpeptidase [Polaromonas sp.]|uniref:L,D-transpeptidase n=1 Tax=Polaromonas sp. TaxID=1869339 RepID=UPI0025FB8DB1|nr:L,D-transpeptidase [Polaromonas sp.]
MKTGLLGTLWLENRYIRSAIDLDFPSRTPAGLVTCGDPSRRSAALALGAFLACSLSAAASAETLMDGVAAASPVPLAAEFAQQVAPRLLLPDDEREAYAKRLQNALTTAQVTLAAPQFIVMVDRSPNVQAALLYWGSVESGWRFIGATPVSTGLPGRYEHFLTPLGVFDHSLVNPDFRAEGTKNRLGFRGYGVKGMRIYDFGWIDSPRGWADGTMGKLRLQMHSTDPVLAEPRLGTAQSEGCVRIPATLNEFIDRQGLLDEDYDRALANGDKLWVLRKDRTPVSSPGRYLVVVDTERQVRPDWAPLPATRKAALKSIPKPAAKPATP